MIGARVLVTGGTGLIGRHAVDALASAGAEVHVLSRSVATEVPRLGAIYYHACNLLDKVEIGAMFKAISPSHFLHLAWETEHGRFWQAPENLDWVAVTCNLARAFVEAGGRRIVGAGTCAEYDWKWPGLEADGCDEFTTPLAPNFLYGRAKRACFDVIGSFAKSEGVEFAWGRVFLLFDPEEHHHRLVASIFYSLLSGKTAACSVGTQLRDFLPAREVGRAFAAIAKSSVLGPINIGSGEPRTIADVATAIGNLVGRPDLVALGTLPTRPDDPPRLTPVVSRLQREVGFSVEDGMDVALTKYWNAVLAKVA